MPILESRAVGLPQFDLLTRMYDRFDPIGAAFGLPPRSAEARRQWIWAALGHEVNVATFRLLGTPQVMLSGCGHVRLRELAIFVHQDYRWRGLGTALVKAALGRGAKMGLRRVWSMTASADRVALRLQRNCGFRLTKSISLEAELEIDLLAPASLACTQERCVRPLRITISRITRACEAGASRSISSSASSRNGFRQAEATIPLQAQGDSVGGSRHTPPRRSPIFAPLPSAAFTSAVRGLSSDNPGGQRSRVPRSLTCPQPESNDLWRPQQTRTSQHSPRGPVRPRSTGGVLRRTWRQTKSCADWVKSIVHSCQEIGTAASPTARIRGWASK